jgi:hypothetical protein
LRWENVEAEFALELAECQVRLPLDFDCRVRFNLVEPVGCGRSLGVENGLSSRRTV